MRRTRVEFGWAQCAFVLPTTLFTGRLPPEVAEHAEARNLGWMDPLFVVLHDPPETGKAKVIGIYSTRDLAEAAVERSRLLPGFVHEPDGFVIHQYEVDKDHWPRGFVRL